MHKNVKKIIAIAIAGVALQLLPSIYTNKALAATNETLSWVYRDFSTHTQLLSIQNNAKVTGSTILLTPNKQNQSGSVFNKQTLSLGSNKSFSTFFSFKISDNGGPTNVYNPTNGADGIVFIVNNKQNSIGGMGGQIGFGGIPNSVGIEFDTWCNGYSGFNDPNNNHIGLNINGSAISKKIVTSPLDLKSGDIVYAWVDYNGESKSLEVRISDKVTRPAEPILQDEIDLSSIFNGEEVYAGFTSGTGADYSNHTLLSWYLDNEYNPIDDETHNYVWNTQPTVEDISKTGIEDMDVPFAGTDFTSKFTDIDGNNLSKVQVTSLPTNGTLKLDGTPVTVGQEILADDLSKLTFTPDANWNGTTSFDWKGSDGVEYSENPAKVNITITPVDDAATVEDISKIGEEGADIPFAETDFTSKFTNVDGDSLSKIQITSLPTNGTLKLDGKPVTVEQEISVDDLSKLTFTPDANWNGTTSFDWKGSDGVKCSENPAKVNITITPVSKTALGNLVVKYLEQGTNNVLAPQITGSQEIGVDYTTTVAKIDGYNLVSTPSNANGKYIDGTTEVIYYYAKKVVVPDEKVPEVTPEVKESQLVVKYLDRDTNKELVPNITDRKPVGTEYTTSAKEINGYQLMNVPNNGSGKYIDGTTEVIYYYAQKIVVPDEKVPEGTPEVKVPEVTPEVKESQLVVKYLDRDTNKELVPNITDRKPVGTEYTTSAKEINGYQLMNVPNNGSGKYIDGTTEVIYYYAQKIVVPDEKVPEGTPEVKVPEVTPEVKESQLVVKYLDKDTNKESAPQEKITEGAPLLPKTGEGTSIPYYILGTLLSIVGLKLNSRKGKKI